MKLLIAYIFTFFCATPLWLNAQEKPLHYIWHRTGVPVYSKPSANTALDTLSYEKEVKIIEVLPRTVDKALFSFQSDTVAKTYSHASKWILIEYDNGKKGYINDTYLLEYPPNQSVGMTDYFSLLSPIVEERNEGKTECFCSQSSITYENGIRFSFTDLGPCESCGHTVTKITLPGWTLHQAFVFITNFSPKHWDMDGVLTDSYPDDITIVGRKDTQSKEFQWEFAYDTVVLTETENEVIVRIDTIL